MADVAAHYDGSAPTYHEQYDQDLIWTNAEYPANFFRLQKVIEILRERGVSNLYDLGAGEASPVIAIGESLGIEFRASDLSPEMVRLGKENLIQHGMDPAWLSLVDIRDMNAVREEAQRVGQFDAVIALGVIPHVEDDEWFVEAMSLFLKPGGTLILQFRNSMFSMFTFNRLTKEFILDELMAPMPEIFQDAVAADLDQRLAVDKPPKRTWDKDAPAYDEILARFHNPFELAEVVKAQGFEDLSYCWYNFHPTYPMIAGGFDPQEYRQAQIDLEADTSWRGMFLCSAGMIIATKAP
jgi:cyclopropane fatty-acyl-phospholipid synthase-like methyltransferase